MDHYKYDAKVDIWRYSHSDKKPIARKGYRRSLGAIFTVLFLSVFMLAAVTQIDVTTQIKGIVPFGNGGTGSSSISTGVVRSNGSVLSGAEISGDGSTSGSNVLTVTAVNGTTVPTNAAADQLLITTASATGAWKSVPNCPAGALQYTSATHLFNCGSLTGATFVDDEIPGGTINGINTTFTLAFAPSPSTSLALYKNGQKLTITGDYSLSTLTITAITAPKTGDTITESYRH